MVIIATTAVALYVGGKILDHIIQDEVWHKRLRHRLFSTKTYQTELTHIIIETIEEFKESNPIQPDPGKFPFYQSKEFLEKLSLFVLFEEGTPETSTQLLELHPNVMVPQEEQLNTFFELFLTKARGSSKLKAHFINENYKSQIFKLASAVNTIAMGVAGVKQDTEKILKQLPSNSNRHRIPKELTLKFPKLRLDQVIGRSEDIEDLRKRLFDNKQVVLVNGMGGIGKTTVAEVYVTQHLGHYKHIVWVSQLTDDFSNDLINSHGLLANLNIDKQDKGLPQLFEELLLALKNIPEGPCLMVIDNATSKLSKFHKLLPGQPKWHVLVTSRERIASFDVKELGFLSEPEAVALFKKHYKRGKIDDDAIAEIVENLEYHTLTIEILAKTAQHQNRSPEAINKAVEEDMEADIIVGHSSEKIEKITSYLSSVFKMSKLDENEKWLLTQFVCLPPEFHTEELLKELIQPDETMEPMVAKFLSNLVNKGWLLYNTENEGFKLHRILSDVMGVSLPMAFDTVKALVSCIADNLKLDQSKDNPVDKFQWIPYGNALLRQFDLETNETIVILQSHLASALQDLGHYHQAKKLLEKALKSDKKNFGVEHPTTAISYSNLAMVLKDLGISKKLKNYSKKH